MTSRTFHYILATIFVCIIMLFTLSTIENDSLTGSILRFDKFSIDSLWQNYRIQNERDDMRFDKWIVMTSINYPTSAVRRYSQMLDWRLIVVGDRKTPNDWHKNLTNCVFLSFDDQMKLHYEIVKQIPSNSYARKIVGYLYAIEHGAKWIYDTDDDNEPYGTYKFCITFF